MITSKSAADGMKRLGRNPRKFRRLRVHCDQHHELLSVYATPNGPVIVGSATRGLDQVPAGDGAVYVREAGGAVTPLCLTLDEYRRLMRVVRDPTIVDPDGFADWLGLDKPTDPDPYGLVEEGADPDIYSKMNINQQYGNTFPHDWLLYFRCRCSQTHVGPAWLGAAMPGVGEPPRDLPGPSGMD